MDEQTRLLIEELQKQLAEKDELLAQAKDFQPVLRDIVNEAVQEAMSKMQEVAEEEISFKDKLLTHYNDFKEPIDKYLEKSKANIHNMFEKAKVESRDFVNKCFDIADKVTDKIDNFKDTVSKEIDTYQNKIDNIIIETREKLIDAKETLVSDLNHEKWKFNQKTEPFVSMIKENIEESREKLNGFKERVNNFVSNTKDRVSDILNRHKAQEITFDYDAMTNKTADEVELNVVSSTKTLTLRHELSKTMDSRIEEDTLALKGAMDYVRANYPLAYEKISGDIAKFNFDKTVGVEVSAYTNTQTGVDCIGVAVTNAVGATLNTIYDIRSMEITDIVYQKSADQPLREVFNKDCGFVNYNLMLNGHSKELINKYDKASETLANTIQNDGRVDNDKDMGKDAVVLD